MIGGMGDEALVFVHSPLVGSLTWRAVADRFTVDGWPCLVPDLAGAMSGPGAHLPRIAATLARATESVAAPIVLIGHSGAGPLLPALAEAVSAPVNALVYVDAGLPHPGESWFARAPADLAAHLRGLASGGSLPPWHKWFPPEAVAALLPDPALRSRFVAQLAELPIAYFDERMPAADWSGPAGYLLLSEAYREDFTAAAEWGMPVAECDSHHLGMLTAPDTVAAALRELLTAALPGPT